MLTPRINHLKIFLQQEHSTQQRENNPNNSGTFQWTTSTILNRLKAKTIGKLRPQESFHFYNRLSMRRENKSQEEIFFFLKTNKRL